MVCLDIVKSFHVPRGGELKSAIDLINSGNQVLIHGAGPTSHEAVGDHAEVVTDVTGALCLAAGVSGIVCTLHLGGVREFIVNGLGGSVY